MQAELELRAADFVDRRNMQKFRKELEALAREFDECAALLHRDADVHVEMKRHQQRPEFIRNAKAYVRHPRSFRLVERQYKIATALLKNLVTLNVPRKPGFCPPFVDEIRRHYIQTGLPPYPDDAEADYPGRLHEYAAAAAEVGDRIRELSDSRDAAVGYLKAIDAGTRDVEMYVLVSWIEERRAAGVKLNLREVAERIVQAGYMPPMDRGDEPDAVVRLHGQIRTAVSRFKSPPTVTKPV